MNRRAHREHKFKLKNRSTNVILKTQRQDFEQSFQIEEQGEKRLKDEGIINEREREELPRCCGKVYNFSDRFFRCACAEWSR